VRLGAAVLGASETVSCGQQTRYTRTVRTHDVKLPVSWYVMLYCLLNKGDVCKKLDGLHFQKYTVQTGGSFRTSVHTYDEQTIRRFEGMYVIPIIL
jgi:hypothetical protein